MKIETGWNKISGVTMLAIWSISAVTSLPGLAISPILGEIGKLFPQDTHLEIDMLTSLPSLMIIPFILLSGKLAERISKVKLLSIGLAIYLLSAVMYLFAKSMIALILIGALLGIGAGIIIPLSTSIIADIFYGKYRVSQLGYSSSISNTTLVIATFAAGILANIEWRLSFIVYFIPLITVVLLFLSQRKKELSEALEIAAEHQGDLEKNSQPVASNLGPLNIMRLAGIYYFVTYSVLTIIFNLPFLLQKEGLSSSVQGTVTAILFLSIMLPGLHLNRVLMLLKGYVNIICAGMIGFSLLMIFLAPHLTVIIACSVIAGLGYGTMQPLIYEKTADASTHRNATLMLGIIMATNYLAILTYPIIMSTFQKIAGLHSDLDPFLINFILCVGFVVVLYFARHTFSVGLDKRYYDKESTSGKPTNGK